MQNCVIEHGATWLSWEHTYALRWVKELGLSTYSQYEDGVCVYGRHENEYLQLSSLRDIYVQQKEEILQLLNIVDTLTINMRSLEQQRNSNPGNLLYQKMYKEYIQVYDNMSVRCFLDKFIKDKTLLELIMHTIEVEACVTCDELSMYNLLLDSSLSNLKVYIGLGEEGSDSLKIREGFQSVICGIIARAKKHKGAGQDLVRLNEPVLEIQNELDHEVRVVTSKKAYRCSRVVWSVPLATSCHIRVSRLSESKRTLFDNQEYGTAVKLFLIFKRPFWRTRFCGNAYFSEDFPFSELCEVSPSNLKCGMVAFFFCADKHNVWESRFKKFPDSDVEARKKQYVLKVIADMFLEGDTASPELQDVIFAERTFKNNRYIRSCYQSVSKVGLAAQIEHRFRDSLDVRDRDENSLIFVGSELASLSEFGTYVEGAIRYTRSKIYHHLQKADPWTQKT